LVATARAGRSSALGVPDSAEKILITHAHLPSALELLREAFLTNPAHVYFTPNEKRRRHIQ
jgi:hypothetical protein